MRRLLLFTAIIIGALATTGCEMDLGEGATFSQECDLAPQFDADGGERVYTFDTQHAWQVLTFDEWVKVDPEAGNYKNRKFTLSVEPNELGEPRSSHILVKFSNGSSYHIPIEQQMRLRFDIEEVKHYVIDAEGGEISIDIATNMKYNTKVTFGKDWAHIGQTRAMMRDEQLNITIDTNRENKSRYATIDATDEDGTLIRRFTIIQSAEGDAINEIRYTTDSDNPIELASTKGFGTEFLAHLHDGRYGRLVFYSTVTALPDDCFKGQSDISTILIPEQVASIGDRAFSGCKELSKITLPSSIEAIGGSVFEGCSIELIVNCNIPSYEFEATNNEGNTELTAMSSNDKRHWLNGSNINTMTLNGNVGTAAMLDYTPLKSLTLLAGAQSLGIDAFGGCSSLERVEVASLEQWCGIDFKSLTANPIANDNAYLYINQERLTALTTPSSLSTIRAYAFAGYDNLHSIEIGNSIKSLGRGCFEECEVESIYLGTALSAVGSYAFNNCSAKSLTINCDLPKFSKDASSNVHWCHGIKTPKVIFGEEVTHINIFALSGLQSVESVVVGNNVKVIDQGAFANCTSIEMVALGNSLTTIGKHAFYGCNCIEGITLPESLKRIEGYAFDGATALGTITIPGGVEYIGGYAFYGCTSLETVYCKPTTPPTLDQDYIFSGAATIYVPSSAYEAYCQAEHWSYFAEAISAYSF